MHAQVAFVNPNVEVLQQTADFAQRVSKHKTDEEKTNLDAEKDAYVVCCEES